MAIAIDQADLGGTIGTADATTVQFTTTAAVASGGFIVVVGGWFGAGGATVSSVSGGGLTWSVDDSGSDTNSACFIASAQAPSGLASSTTITVTFSGTVSVPTVSGLSFTGVATSSALDGTTLGPVHVSTAAWSSGNYTTSAAAVVVGVNWSEGAVASNTETSPSVEAHEYIHGVDHYGHVAEYRIESSAGAYPVAGTWDAAAGNTTFAAAYLAAGGGTPTGASDLPITVGIVSTGTPTAFGAADSPITVTIGSAGTAYQTLHPSADSADGNWTDDGGGTALAAAIDETTASDSDYIQSEFGPSSSGCRVKLESSGDPESSSGHIIRWRVGKNQTGGDTINMTVTLRQGGADTLGAGTQIATFNRNAVDSLTTYEETLSGTEADSITDYGDLYLEFYADTV